MGHILGITYADCKALPLGIAAALNSAMPITSEQLAIKLREQMNSKGTKPPELAELCEVRVPSVYDWLDHGRIAKKHLPRLAAFFGTSLGYWLGEEDEDVNPLDRQLLTLARTLPDDFRDELLQFANDLHNKAHGNQRSAANPYPTPPPPAKKKHPED